MTREELLKLRPEFAEHIARRPPLKPRPTVTAQVSSKIVEVAKANPTGVQVRVSATAADGTTYVDPPKRPTEIIQVLEVDREGRPKLLRRTDCSTGEAGLVECREGYRLPPSAQHEYNPMDGLRRAEDE